MDLRTGKCVGATESADDTMVRDSYLDSLVAAANRKENGNHDERYQMRPKSCFSNAQLKKASGSASSAVAEQLKGDDVKV